MLIEIFIESEQNNYRDDNSTLQLMPAHLICFFYQIMERIFLRIISANHKEIVSQKSISVPRAKNKQIRTFNHKLPFWESNSQIAFPVNEWVLHLILHCKICFRITSLPFLSINFLGKTIIKQLKI